MHKTIENNTLEIGQKAPNFTLSDENNNHVSLSDYKGQKIILYFYPAANSPGCTTQACDFRDSLSSLKAAGYVVLGISPDSVKKLREFSKNRQLNFSLLSDADHKVAEEYGAWGTKKSFGRTSTGLIRSTFAIDEQGNIILAQYNVRAAGHVAKLRRDLDISPEQ